MLTPSGRGSYQISHCEKFGALRGPEADSAGGPTDGHNSESYGRSLRASVGDGAAAGAWPIAALRSKSDGEKASRITGGSCCAGRTAERPGRSSYPFARLAAL